MNDKTVVSIHWSFWLIGVVALIWNVMGAANFLWQINANSLSSYPEAERLIIENRPIWATAAFAIAVFGGALGAILLLLKKSAATNVLIVSLLGVVVATAHAFGAVGLKSFVALMPPLSALVVASFLVWYSKLVESKGWINQA
ncbi:MAG: hypothetical protein K8F25_10050 [Fimbriimonadaceae bacterium]|nr:hypothetical protein [Alphaproteobacteria bacterium]